MYNKVKELSREGLSIRQISRNTGLDRATLASMSLIPRPSASSNGVQPLGTYVFRVSAGTSPIGVKWWITS